MGHRRTSRAIAVVTAVWVVAAMAALALATTRDDAAAAQKGCRGGGGSPSPSESASPSPSESSLLPTIVPSLIPARDGGGAQAPAPNPRATAAAPQSGLDPYEKVPVAAAQAQGVTCKSTVTLAYKTKGRNAFKGKVGSDEPMCKKARRVLVKKVKKGKDRTVARGVTNARGAYTAPEANAKGRYYAVVKKSTTENDDGESVTCQAARSKTIRA